MAFILLGGLAAVATVLYLHRLDAGHEFREDRAMLLNWLSATAGKTLAASRQAWTSWPEARGTITHRLGKLPETLGAIRFRGVAAPQRRIENGPPSADFIAALEAILADDLARREGARGTEFAETSADRHRPAPPVRRSKAA